MTSAEDLYKIHSEQRTKLIYYTMGIAVAAVGFAVVQTVTATLSWQLIPWSVAVLCWLASIWYGLRSLGDGLWMLRLQVQRLTALSGLHPITGVPMVDWQKDTTVKALETRLQAVAKESDKPFNRQRGFLIAGVVVFIVWHLWRIAHESSVVIWGVPL